MAKVGKIEYISKVRVLNEEEAERLLSRMTGKLPRRLEKEKLSKEEAMALQMELEDEQLNEWRKVMNNIKLYEEAKKKGKDKAKAMASSKPKAAKTTKGPSKAKASSKPKSAKTTKAPSKAKAAE